MLNRRLFLNRAAGLSVAWLTNNLGHPGLAARGEGVAKNPGSPVDRPAIDYIDTGFENASPFWYEFKSAELVDIHLVYDLERNSPNRAAGHFHFAVEGKPGSVVTLEFKNLENVWNGQPGSVAKELKTAVISEDSRRWKSVSMESLPENRVQLKLRLPSARLYVARVEPYRVSDLEKMVNQIRHHRLIEVKRIGKTVAGRELEVIRIGHQRTRNRVFLRARAHAWEAGSSWVLEGLVRRLLRGDTESKQFMERYCVYVLPLANMDGVAQGRTRFNLQGKDLNRDWQNPADPRLAPENHALERWLENMIATGQTPNLAMELHNDGNGQLHISRPPVPWLKQYLNRMEVFQNLLRKYTWFTEGATPETFRNEGTLAEQWVARYHIDAVVHEFNCNWIRGINDYPSAAHWMSYGANLAKVFYEYFDSEG